MGAPASLVVALLGCAKSAVSRYVYAGNMEVTMKLESWEKELRGNPEDWVPVEAKVSKNPGCIFSFRLTGAELGHISQSARSRGLSVSDFIRQAALWRANSDSHTGSTARAIVRTGAK